MHRADVSRFMQMLISQNSEPKGSVVILAGDYIIPIQRPALRS